MSPNIKTVEDLFGIVLNIFLPLDVRVNVELPVVVTVLGSTDSLTASLRPRTIGVTCLDPQVSEIVRDCLSAVWEEDEDTLTEVLVGHILEPALL